MSDTLPVMQMPMGFSMELFIKLTPEVQKELIQAQRATVELAQRSIDQKHRSEDLKMMADILGMARTNTRG